MKRFLIKFLLLVIAFFLIFMSGIFVTARKIDFNNFPKNNVSNSSSFRAKLDYTISRNYLKNCSFLISGSSMSLNNISGKIIQKRTHENVYNISSFGTKPIQTAGLLKSNLVGHQIKYLLIAFNNCDFGNSNFNIDYSASNVFVNGNSIKRCWIFLETFNMVTFFSDLNDRTRFSNIVNSYKSLSFDETGSIQFDRKGFIINKERWESYYDTTGFKTFFNNTIELNGLCKENNITLFLIYLPFRSDLLSEERKRQNTIVSNKLELQFGCSFFDLSNVSLSADDYCDGIHFFKEGAENITNIILDSFQLQNNAVQYKK